MAKETVGAVDEIMKFRASLSGGVKLDARSAIYALDHENPTFVDIDLDDLNRWLEQTTGYGIPILDPGIWTI